MGNIGTMANSNFVVHNGLTVGPTTIDAASGNVSIPVGKMITIGNIILRDNGNGQLAVRDITDNSDAIVNATLDSGTQTLGNIQIGTNHIESMNTNGQIALRPNGTGNIALSSNTIDVGRGGDVTITTGTAFASGNITLAPGTGKFVKLSDTDASTSSATGALIVSGGVGVAGAVYVNSANNLIAIGNGGSNGTGNIGATGAGFNTVFALATSANYADLAENYLADAAYAPGTVVHFGGEFEVTLCDTDGCTKVAGVVSTNPAHLMNTGLEGTNVVAVALNGRVPCLVQGTVQKGDLMVSAGNGRARAEANPRVGSVIGKAIENSQGDAVIEVVVGVR